MTGNENYEMPMHRLDAYRVAKEFLATVVEAQISDAKLRDQAVRAAQSTCLNIAESTGRWSAADRARVCHIARGECCEAVAALEIASISGSCDAKTAAKGAQLGSRLYALLSGLIRR